jgi:hypothetical protein
VVGLLLGGDAPPRLAGVTVLPSLSGAVTALGHATRYAAWRRQPGEAKPAADYGRSTTLRAWVRTRLAEKGPGWLGPCEAETLLTPYAISAAGVVVMGVDAATRAACDLGFPVALKVADPSVVHKTERGLVRAGLISADDVTVAAKEMAAAMGTDGVEILVQRMVAGTEVAVGVVRDRGLGPLVRVAAGGVATEVWEDQRLLMAPVTHGDALNALRSLRIWPLLAGFRAQAAADTNALVDLVVAVGLLAFEVPELAEVDLNPVLVNPDGCELVDVKIRVTPALLWDPVVPRRLRPPPATPDG